ncbi:prevent-host-death family protein [Actinophytocola xinjiangensis]|uniref:Antitoxin n=1 Tax=Actinophytocola xinjiangensis TaxID=485602 RepID=A0A7Z1AZE8_9PSEU|nr:type II toxin-antitoxin system prevent-host-death family antitoxin [Actinophytocola xinjiangensis]OLF10988.1 prevent-host-death family protein [Actinophytocola xinjiangensis]
MEQVPIRELNQDTAGVLARVEAGESLEITNRGKPIARLVPAGVPDEVSDLVAAGRMIPASHRGPFVMPTLKAPVGADAGELISRLRDEERF